jgi:RimJ/RimL family protein N-acetyltransferase
MKEFKLKRLEAEVFKPNIASATLLLKNGFVLEGICKNFYCKFGNCYDKLIFAKVL